MIPAVQSSQILKFIGAGGLGVLLYYLVLFILTDVAGLWYMVSAAIASVVNFSSNFLLQKFWTFENKGTKNIHQQAGNDTLLTASLFVSNLLFLYVLVQYTHLWYLAAQVIITAALTVISYLVSRRIFVD